MLGFLSSIAGSFELNEFDQSRGSFDRLEEERRRRYKVKVTVWYAVAEV